MFCLVLPNNLPPSHEVPFGYTRYTLKAYYNNQKVSTFFSVNQWVGLEKRNDIVVSKIILLNLFFVKFISKHLNNHCQLKIDI